MHEILSSKFSRIREKIFYEFFYEKFYEQEIPSFSLEIQICRARPDYNHYIKSKSFFNSLKRRYQIFHQTF